MEGKSILVRHLVNCKEFRIVLNLGIDTMDKKLRNTGSSLVRESPGGLGQNLRRISIVALGEVDTI